MELSQPFGMAALAVFLMSYLFSAGRGLLTPESYRADELSFYQTGKPAPLLVLMFVLNEIAFVLALIHVVMEGPQLGQALLYAMTAMHSLLLPFHFIPFFRSKMARTLKMKTDRDYRGAALKKLSIAVGLILLPFIVK